MRIDGIRRSPCAVLVLAAAIAGCAVPAVRQPPGTACATDEFVIDDAFPGARRGECTVYTDGRVRLAIVPEDPPPINDSAWYAFRITPAGPGTAEIALRYDGGHHRYVPKLSVDGASWTPIDETPAPGRRARREARLRIALDGRPLYVAAQPLVMPGDTSDWLESLALPAGTAIRELGRSAGDRPIHVLEHGADRREIVMIVGRQHPPEVSGSFALEAFVERLLGDDALASRFRERYGLVVIPMLNPDGVLTGHWRNNLGGKDLNRDWGPFTQPETRLIADLLGRIDTRGSVPRLFLDFHSTRRNLFYTQQDDDVTVPQDFATRWLDAARPRVGGYPFAQEKRHNLGQPTAKNYMFQRYGIPSLTYEVGDETERPAAAAAAAIFAEEMMRLLVEYADR